MRCLSLIKKAQRDIYLKTNSVNDKSGLVNSLFLGVGDSNSVAMLLQCLTDGAGTRHFGTQSICVKQEKGVCVYIKVSSKERVNERGRNKASLASEAQCVAGQVPSKQYDWLGVDFYTPTS